MLKFKQLVAALISAVALADDSATVPPASSLSSEQLDAILRQPAPGGRALTVDDFMKRLPEGYRRGYTLMYRSQSSQGGTPDNPRQIFYGSDARTIISIGGDPKNSNYNTVEMMSWDEDSGKFVMRQIPFPRQPGPLSKVETNPTECTSCHNDPPRPNWAPHNSWPGAYCSTGRKFQDATCTNDTEAAAYRKFDSHRAKGPRSKYLPTLTAKQVETILGPAGNDADKAAFRKNYQLCANGAGIDPNSKLSELASELNFKRILRQLESKDSFRNQYKYAFAAVALGCTDACIDGRWSPMPCPKSGSTTDPRAAVEDLLPKTAQKAGKTRKDLETDTASQMKSDYDARTRDLNNLGEPSAPERCGDSAFDKSRGAVNFDLSDAKLVATTRYFAERIGVNMSEWSMAYAQGTYSFASGIDGLDRVYQLYLLEQLQKPDPSLPSLAPFLKTDPQFATEVPGRLGVTFTGTPADKARLCADLKTRSLRALSPAAAAGGAGGRCPSHDSHPLPPPTVKMLQQTKGALGAAKR